MSNVIDLLPLQRRPCSYGQDPLAAFAAISARVARIGDMPMESKEDMQQAILLLGLSNVHARRLITGIADGDTRSRLIAHSERIGELVEIARRKAAAL